MKKLPTNAKPDKTAQQPVEKSTKKATKKQLSGDHRKRRALTRTRIMRYGFRNFSRNAWLTVAATAVMTITLLIIFATAMASSMLSETIKSQREKMDISLYFKYNISDDTLRNLAGRLRVIPNVSSTDISNSDQEYNKAVEANKNDKAYMDALSLAAANGDGMQLPAVIHVKLINTDDRSAVDDLVAHDSQFQEWIDKNHTSSDEAATRENTVKRLSDIMTFARQIGFGAAAIFVVISVLIIFNTIRMAIFSRREEIDMMKAIGADHHFIRGPFLVEAELYGVIAAVLATSIGYLVMIKVMPSLGRYIEVSKTESLATEWFWLILLVMVALGLIIGSVSARLAVRRYLKP